MAMVRTDVPVPPAVNETGFTLKVNVRPVTVVGDAASEILPVKPKLFNVMADVAELPATKLAGVAALAAMVKSGVTVTETVVDWAETPVAVPVTVIVYVPAGVDAVVAMVRTEVPVPPAVRATGFTLKEKVRPVTAIGVEAVSVTLRAEPKLVRVMVEVAEPPATKLAGVAALAPMVKPLGPTVNMTVAEWDGTPVPVPVTVIV